MRELPDNRNLFEGTAFGARASRHLARLIGHELNQLDDEELASVDLTSRGIGDGLYEPLRHLASRVVDVIDDHTLLDVLEAAGHITPAAHSQETANFARQELDEFLDTFAPLGLRDAVVTTLAIPPTLRQPEALAVATNPETLASVRRFASDPTHASVDIGEGEAFTYDPATQALKASGTPVEGRGCPLTHGTGRRMNQFFTDVSSFVIAHAIEEDRSSHWQP
jgi:hypothetical protein